MKGNNNYMKITVCGKQYDIVFNFGVLKEVCEECECNTPAVLEKISLGDLRVLSSVIKHGILFNHEDFDVEQVSRMPIGEVLDSFVVVGKLVADGMPKVKESKKTKVS